MSMTNAKGDPNRVRIAVDEFGDGRTMQADHEKTDIRRILAKAKRTGGAVAYMTSKQAFYADISDSPSYMEALNVVAKAQQQFELLPSEIRDRFNNDPSKFLAFANDEKNAEEMVKLGLRKPVEAVPEPAPMKVEVINSTGDSAKEKT